MHCEVVIIGAGAAGLAAAQSLSQAGIDFQILEARNRIGGRIHTRNDPLFPLPVELGAEFVHGSPPVLCDFARKAGHPVAELPEEHWIRTEGGIQKDSEPWDALGRVMDRLLAPNQADRSFAEFIRDTAQGAFAPDEVALAKSFVEGFHAADLDAIGARALAAAERESKEIDGGAAFRPKDGYSSLMQSLLRTIPDWENRLSLDCHVEEIRWRSGAIEVFTRREIGSNQPYCTARSAIITLPIGVLKRSIEDPGTLRWTPELPGDKLRALEKIHSGPVIKQILRFREPVWESSALQGLSFIHSHELPFPTWWSARPESAPIITAWAGGPAARRLGKLSTDQKLAAALESLGSLLERSPSELRSQLLLSHSHDWQTDPFSLGAYSYLGVGGLEAQAALARPVGNTLYFAGEATHFEGQTGTVDGAMTTGIRAANEVKRALP